MNEVFNEVKLHDCEDQSSMKNSISINSLGSACKKFQCKEKLHIKFTDLSVSIYGTEILKNISGEINPGEILAIMGPSGTLNISRLF